MSNRDYIEKYKDSDEVTATYFAVRDRSGKAVLVDGIVNPLKIDNRQAASVADQQGNTPHCAAYSIANLCEALLWKRTGRLVNLNADQIYAHAKMIDGDPDTEGTFLECAIRSAMKLGGFANPEKLKIGFLNNDGSDAAVEAFKYLMHKYDFVHCGFDITDGWYRCDEKNPRVSHTPNGLGGHAVLGVGYDQEGAYIQNSWGKEWGAKSFAVVPWDVFKKELMYCCYVQNCFDGMEEG